MAQSPLAFVSQNGSGSYNNFRGNNYRTKGKGKKLYSQNSQGYQFNGPQSQHAQGFNLIYHKLNSSFIHQGNNKLHHRITILYRYVKFVIENGTMHSTIFKMDVRFVIEWVILLLLTLIGIILNFSHIQCPHLRVSLTLKEDSLLRVINLLICLSLIHQHRNSFILLQWH